MKNTVQIMGNIGHINDLKVTKSGKNVIDFTLATNESWKTKDGEERKRTLWHSITCWDKEALKVSQTFDTGDLVEVKGKINYSEWETDSGEKRKRAFIQAFETSKLVTGSSNRAPSLTTKDIPFEGE